MHHRRRSIFLRGGGGEQRICCYPPPSPHPLLSQHLGGKGLPPLAPYLLRPCAFIFQDGTFYCSILRDLIWNNLINYETTKQTLKKNCSNVFLSLPLVSIAVKIRHFWPSEIAKIEELPSASGPLGPWPGLCPGPTRGSGGPLDPQLKSHNSNAVGPLTAMMYINTASYI